MTLIDMDWWRGHCEQEAMACSDIATVQHQLATAQKMLKMAEGHQLAEPDPKHLEIATTAGIRIEVFTARLKQLRGIA